MKLFIHENASENIVCQMEAILSRGRSVKLALKSCMADNCFNFKFENCLWFILSLNTARASAIMIFIMLNQINLVPAH